MAGGTDMVAVVRVKEHEQLAEVVTGKLLKMTVSCAQTRSSLSRVIPERTWTEYGRLAWRVNRTQGLFGHSAIMLSAPGSLEVTQ